MSDKSQKTHSGDCHWWPYHVCDCGWLMRAHSGDFGPPSDEVYRDFSEHSQNLQRASAITHDRAELAFLQDQLTQAQAELAKFHEAMERERKPDWEKQHLDLATRLERVPSSEDVLTAAARTALHGVVVHVEGQLRAD